MTDTDASSHQDPIPDDQIPGGGEDAPVLGDAAAPPAAPQAAQPATPMPTPPAAPLAAQPALPPPFVAPGGLRTQRTSAWIAAFLAPVLAVALFLGGAAADRSGWFGGSGAAAATAAPSGGAADLALIEEAWRDLHEHYVDAKNLDDQALAYGAISGMTQAVGDVGHTSFLTAAQSKAVDQSLSGTFVGIGVRVTGEANAVVIASIIPGTPAADSGLRRGDQIVAVDGTATTGETVDQVVARVRGPEGEDVTLTIARAGQPNFDLTITRRKFDLPLVSWAMAPGRTVAVIRLDQFATGATKAIKDAITGAKAAGATALILDLRGNPGGYVNEAIGVTSQFVGDGIVYRAIDASGKETDSPVEPGGLATHIPMVVLTDGGTASSAEIVTGAIQDAGRGKVVGEKTFGTGTVLGRFDLADGSSLRIGVERWLTRAGRPIWHEGLLPDVTVALAADAQPVGPDELRDMTVAQLAASSDAQLLKALQLLAGQG